MKILGPIDQIRKKVKKLQTKKYLKKRNIIKKLCITEKDFRKLCIYKGIYPESYKKVPAAIRGKFAKEKICYPKEVVSKLSHEKVIHHFRKTDAALKRYNVLKNWYDDTTKARNVIANLPKLTIDHILKKRFPNLCNAIEHLTDAVSTISVYSHLSFQIVGGLNAHFILECKQLMDYFHYYIYKTQKLTKAFIAVDRYYLLANILGKDVTWIIPSGPTFSTWNQIKNVSKVTEFVEYYIFLLKYVLFKLYQMDSLTYPPCVDEYLRSENLRHLAYDPEFSEAVKQEKQRKEKKNLGSNKKIECVGSTNEIKEKKKK